MHHDVSGTVLLGDAYDAGETFETMFAPGCVDVFFWVPPVDPSRRDATTNASLPGRRGVNMLTNALPPFLEARGEAIYIAGHRITLFAVMQLERNRKSAAAAFPAVSKETLAKVSDFCRRNPHTDVYYAEQLEIQNDNRRRYGTAPSADVLRARLASKP